ncbi:hypothetical protein FH972_011149 [Carpinus fangiana]|uniref:Uncharacterized protein n=1 Tax=Carpinus fangiana TaxID=176857 RepID=A0A660KTF7_9ROSI|nr:hypothetical protein FH972_011149 [Carpinus fangiana]
MHARRLIAMRINLYIDSASSTILSKEPNCVEIDCHGEDSRAVVVGDIHDLLYVPPRISYMSSMGTIHVDKGTWGLEKPSWAVLLPDDVDGTKLVQVPQAPEVEGLPLPPNLEEPHKSAYEYFFKLTAALKHMLQTRETKGQKRRRHD